MGYLVNPKQDLSVLKLHIQQTVPNPLAIKLEVGDGEIHALVGPSGSGKTVLLQNMILDIYRGCFSKIFIFSPSIHVDASWLPVKEYIEKHMKVTHTDEEPIYLDHYDPDVLADIIDTQHKITDYMKKQNHKHLFQILVIVDDFADDPSFSRRSKLLHSLFTRGRHNSISTIVATQKFYRHPSNYPHQCYIAFCL